MKLFSNPLLLSSQFPQYKFVFYENIDSTNSECQRLVQKNQDNWVVIADQQSAGRGRQGRIWQSEEGINIYFSFLFKNIFGNNIAKLNFFFGIVIYETLKELYKIIPLTLKWPNDIYLNDKKLGGILIENIANDLTCVIVGIGINVYAKENQIPTIATSLSLATALKENARIDILKTFFNKLQQDKGEDIEQRFWQYSQFTREQIFEYTYLNNNYQGTLKELHQDGSITICNPEGQEFHIR